MNHSSLPLIVFLCFGLHGCGGDSTAPGGSSGAEAGATEPAPVIASAPGRFNRVLAGTIDGKHAIQMELNRNTDGVYGRYFYESNTAREYLNLNGTMDAAGNIELTETVGEKETGVFIGKLVSEVRGEESTLKLTGDWKKSKTDSAVLAFEVAEKRFDLDGMKLVLKAQSEGKDDEVSIDTSFPQLTGNDPRALHFNQVISDFVSKAVGEFKQDFADPAVDLPDYLLNLSYLTLHADRNVVSLLFTNYSYTGGAHGNAFSTAFNYDVNRGQFLKLADLFQPNSNYLDVISQESIRKINVDEYSDPDWIRNGAAPKAENYQSWNITTQGLTITFDAYQVASYAEGPQEVVVPYSALKSIIKPDGVLAQLAQ